MLADYLKCAGADITCISTTWYQLWKHPAFVIQYPNGSIKGTNASFALRCKGVVRFGRKRAPDVGAKGRHIVLDASCYHYGYVHSDEDMYTKINTWGHAQDFDRDLWFNLKWLNWSLDTRNIAPINPCGWPRAVWFPMSQPKFVYEIFGPNLGLSASLLQGRRALPLAESLYDFKHEAYSRIKSIRNFLIG